MNWKERIFGSLTETVSKRASRHLRSPASRVKKPSKRGMRRRGSLVAAKIRKQGPSKPRRSDADTAEILQNWAKKHPGFEPSDKPHPYFDDAELGQMGDTTARERSRTHGRR